MASKLIELMDEKKKREEARKPPVIPGLEWREQLIVDDKYKPKCRVHNYAVVLDNDERFKGSLHYNEFSDLIYYRDRIITDSDIIGIKAQLEGEFDGKVASADVFDAVVLTAQRHSIHPVRQYLAGLRWDGIERIKYFFSDHCGTPNDEYHQGAAIAHFISAVKRIAEPGCQVDLMVVLESNQGWGKTSLWNALYGDWYREVTESLSSKDFFQCLRGAWCADFGEMHQIRKADVERYKQIITIRSDSYRPSYGRCVKVFPRECIFVGGTNQEQWLTDATGGRRFLPVRLAKRVDVRLVAEARDQLFAEAVATLPRSEALRWWEVDGAEQHQGERMEVDPWAERIESALEDKAFLLRGVAQYYVTVPHIMTECLGLPTSDHSKRDAGRVRDILKLLGWENVPMLVEKSSPIKRVWRLPE